ncbi:MAG: 30S ribosome-binding factor RbfA [Limnochordales bacterium]|nr:30S ribosome-binding factor RbfA [Limnochordales bacterium]
MNVRLERLREEIKREVTDIIRRFKDPRLGFVTVTDVELSRDLEHARIFVSAMGDAAERKQTFAVLQAASGHVRSELAKRIRMRHVPEIVFAQDESIERGLRIDRLLRELSARENPEVLK